MEALVGYFAILVVVFLLVWGVVSCQHSDWWQDKEAERRSKMVQEGREYEEQKLREERARDYREAKELWKQQ